MSYCLNLPINSVSFGQTSTMLLRDLFERGREVTISPIGDRVDLSSQKDFPAFSNWIQKGVADFSKKHDRNNPAFRLWHLNGSLESVSKKNILMSFYELDSPTEEEVNIAKNCDTLIFSSKETQKVFSEKGVESKHIPLAFDKYNFSKKEKVFFDDKRVVFNLVGKFEKRKHHEKVIKSWVKRFGNDSKYSLQCSVYNNFLSEQQNKECFFRALGEKRYENVQFLGFMPKNSLYNDYLNSGDIILAMSGGEGWGLPEFHSVAIGKHAVVLNVCGYREWANKDNSILVEPSGKIDAYDGVFFHPNKPFNQGKIYDFNPDELIHACEEAVKLVEKQKVNQNGLKLQQEFSIEKMTDKILELF